MLNPILLESLTSLAAARLISGFLSGASLHQSWLSVASVLLILIQALMAFFVRWHIVVPPMSDASLAMRLLILTMVHASAVAAEARWREGRHMEWRRFCRSLCVSGLYVAPGYPLLAIGGSTILMLCTSLASVIGVDPRKLHWLIELGSLHAPFWFVHVEVRRARAPMRREGVLPLTDAADKVEVDAARADRFHVRSQRLLRFAGVQQNGKAKEPR